MASIGYGRVSTRDQHPEGQHHALTAAGCDHIFIDKASGTLHRRPELDKALLVLRAGDTFTVTEIAATFGVSRPTIYRHLNPT